MAGPLNRKRESEYPVGRAVGGGGGGGGSDQEVQVVLHFTIPWGTFKVI